MNKFLTKIIGASLAIAMMIGVGAGVNAVKEAKRVFADDTDSITFNSDNFNNLGSNDYGNGAERTGSVVSSGDQTIDLGSKYTTINSGWQWKASDGIAYNKTALPGRITNITVAQTGTNRAFTVRGGTSLCDAKSSGTQIGNSQTAASMSWDIETGNYNYFVICRGSNAAKVTSIVVTFETTGGELPPEDDSVTVSLDKTKISMDVNGSATAYLKATAVKTGNATLGLAATSSNESVATVSTSEPVSGTAFTVTAHAAGSAIITVKSTWDENVSATCAITVFDTTPRIVNFKRVNSLSAGMRVLITSVVDDTYYYLPSTTTGGSTPPSAVACTYNSTNNLIESIDVNKAFLVSGNNEGWQFTNASDSYLYISGNSDNNSIRVGSTSHSFTANSTENGYYLQSTSFTRYVGIYNKTDWRCYNSRTANNYKWPSDGTKFNCDFINFWVEAKPLQTISGATSAYTDETVSLASTATNPTWSIVEGDTTAEGAQVTAAGVVSATGAGSVKVKASHANYEDAYFTITFSIRPTESYINVDPSSVTGFTGQNETLSFEFGNIDNPESAIAVISSNTSVVTVNEPSIGATSGTVQINFVGAGETTVKFNDGESEKASVTVTVTQSSVSITGMPATSTVFINDTINLASQITVTATGSYSNNVTWESDDEAVATVTDAGVVTGVAQGTANITVTSESDNNVSATCAVTVSRALFQSVNSFQNGKRYVLAASNNCYLPAATQTKDKNPVAAQFNSMNDLTKADAWRASVDAENHILFSNTVGNETFYLNAKEAAQGVCVGKTASGYWTLNNDGYLIHSNSGDRFLAANGTTDFRQYTSLSQPGASFVTVFYEYIATTKEQVEEIKTLSALTYDYEQDGDAYTYDNVAIRFGGFMSQTLWNELGVVEFGVFLASADDLHNSIKAEYESALDLAADDIDGALTILCGEHNGDEDVRRYYGTNPVEATEKQKAFNGVNQEETYYTWTVRKNVTNALTTYYTAVAYVRTATEIIFLDETSESAKHLAVASLARTDNADPAYDSLAYFAAH